MTSFDKMVLQAENIVLKDQLEALERDYNNLHDLFRKVREDNIKMIMERRNHENYRSMP